MTATRNVRAVAHWRQLLLFNDAWTKVRVPALNPDKSMDNMLWPPMPGVLPAYDIVLDNAAEKESFREWLKTLSVADQRKVHDAIILERMQ